MKRKDYAIITAMVMGASLATSATATQAQPNQSTAAKHANTSVASVKPSGAADCNCNKELESSWYQNNGVNNNLHSRSSTVCPRLSSCQWDN